MWNQLAIQLQRGITYASRALSGKQTTAFPTQPFAGSGLVQSAKSGFGAVSSGTSGRVLTAGVGVGAGTAAAGTGIGFGVQQVSEPLFDITDKIDEQLGFSGVGSMVIIGIIIVAVILLLRMVLK